MKLTAAEENYILAIHRLSNGDKVSTNQLAEEIGIAAPSVTDMVQKLAEKEYVRYEKYKGVSLLPTGMKIAKNLSNTKSLWRDFLQDHLQLTSAESQQLLEQLQHVQSPNFAKQFYQYLNTESENEVPQRPKQIIREPIKEQVFENREKLLVKELKPQQDLFEVKTEQQKEGKRLTDCNVGEKVFLTGIGSDYEQAQDLLTYVRLPLGVRVEIKKFYVFDESILIAFGEEEQLVSKQLASLVLVG